mgnify:CR=1 FL=1
MNRGFAALFAIENPKNIVSSFYDDENEEIDEPEDNSTEDAEKAVLEILCDNLSTAEKLTSELSTWGSLWHDIKIEQIWTF